MEINLMDPAVYDNGQPFDQFRWLRENDPVHWHAMPSGDSGFFAVTRYADVKAIETDFERFSNEPTSTLFDDNKQGDDTHKTMIYSDPPWHTGQRRFLTPEFSPKSVTAFVEHLRTVVDDVIDEVIEAGSCDAAADLGGRLASYVTADVLGLPRPLLVELYELTEELNSTKSTKEGQGLRAMQKMMAHAEQIFADRRANPRADMVSRMVNGTYNDQPVDLMQFTLDFNLVVNAGGDTTRAVVAGGLLALLENPDEFAKLRLDPSLAPTAVDEMLRWVSPVIYQRRTALADAEIAGTHIPSGSKVAVFYGAANRDPRVYTDPDRFDVQRTPNPHAAFGFGRHYCLGSHLARVELIAMFEALVERMSEIEQAGAAVWTLPPGTSPTLIAPRSLPIRFTPDRRRAPAVATAG